MARPPSPAEKQLWEVPKWLREKEIPGQLAKPAKAEGTLALTTGQAPRIQRPGVGGLGIWEKRRL